ncbi:hypothetical protein D9M68_652820 [compost metagenome]
MANRVAFHIGLVLELLVAQVADETPAVAQVEVGRAVQVPGALAVGRAEEIAGCVGVLEAVAAVRGAQVEIGVVVVAALRGVRTRVVVVQHARVQREAAADVTLPAAVEIHFQVAVGEHEAGNVRVPVAQVEAGTVGQVEAQLHGGPEVGLRIAAEAIVAGDGGVAAERKAASQVGGFGQRRRGEANGKHKGQGGQRLLHGAES